jgi:hypothetical protein
MDGNRLVLGELHVNLDGEDGGTGHPQGPDINGVCPTRPGGEYDWFNHHYAGMGLPVDYSGGLLLADGFIRECMSKTVTNRPGSTGLK